MLKRLALVYVRPLFKNHVYTVRNGLAKGLRRKGGLGFLPFKLPSPENRFLMKLDFAGRTVYDIGGWEGLFTMFFARAAGPSGHVITFEPNSENCDKIRDNLGLNCFTNATLFPVALGKAPGKATLAVRSFESGTGSLHDGLKSQIMKEADSRTLEVEIDTLDHRIKAYCLPPPDFVKIDVEGMEVDVVEGMEGTIRHVKPKLFIEVHKGGPQGEMGNAQALVSRLEEQGYSILHVESGEAIKRENASWVNGGHIFCS